MASTPATRALQAAGVPHELVAYDYRGGGAEAAADALDIDPHAIVKTLVMSSSDGAVLALMHGDREVSTKALARRLGVKRVEPASTHDAERLTGYRVGGMSPLGTRTALPVVCQTSIVDLEAIHVNAGSRGLLARLAPADLVELTNATLADITA